MSARQHRKRPWTREQLLQKLQIIGTIHTALPPDLPPSPPVSRTSSPAPTKRKYDAGADYDRFKRPRTASLISDRPSHQHRQPASSSQLHPPNLRPPTHTPLHISRAEPCEDGEVREEPPVASSSRLPAQAPPATIAPNNVPVRRPKRGKTDYRHHDALHDKYHNAGRQLKYSGDARFWSTYPATHKEYRPLLDPPLPNSSYHIHGGLIARLELVDALVCFTFALWNKDYGRKNCNRYSWCTIEAFLGWCKGKWQAEEEGMIEAEKAFIGLIFMIEGFIHARKLVHMAQSHLERDVTKLYEELRADVNLAASKAEQDNLSGVNHALLALKPQATPPMLPSPASIAPANSTNGTPTTQHEGTPNTTISSSSGLAAQRAAPHHPSQNIIPEKLLPERYKETIIPAHIMDAMAATSKTIGPTLMYNLKEQTCGTTAATYCMTNAQACLNLTTLVRFFPATFARVIYTTLSPTDEHEPDFEDEEGELFWPGQSITGEGLGWVCLLGKAMIKEFGKAYGYRGLDGVVPKPKPEEEDANKAPPPHAHSQPQRPGSTPHGHIPHGHTPLGHTSQAAPSSSIQR
ncbi:hypothetical protein Hypma_007782 [Hypsizygus marmoreus]|uniref:Uncharacterized protein n=1 Tax=Hypsizygus marmoreus TaxID=39966 RepID=A0A369K2S3_HYPMA|nr:hypothetical protein Hypma_007782 [Hypsizygus marmoreus]